MGFVVTRLTLAQMHSFPTCGRMEKRGPRQSVNMDLHFIDFAPRRSEYGSNHCRVMETKMSFCSTLILATVLAAWSAAASGETIKIGA
ncbi:hypothetical protein ACVWZ6_008013 [Bradyrhizobium sp. GM6.1]